MSLHDFLASLGIKGSVVIAGAAGGLVRWFAVKAHPVDGIIAIVVGAIMAAYAAPLALPIVDAILGHVIVEEEARAGFSGFIMGLGGVSVVGYILERIRSMRNGDGDQ